MKRKCLHVTVQPHEQSSFWIENAINAMQGEAAKCSATLSVLTGTEGDLHGELVYIVGTSEAFCRAEAARILAQGGHPFVVNGGMSRTEGVACVAFDIEGAIRDSLFYLVGCGRRRLLLFGINRSSYADKLKLDAFLFYASRLGVTFATHFCETSIGAAARDFVSRLSSSEYDAVLAVNDTAALSLLSAGILEKVKIPESLYLMGMGNSLLGARGTLPLTTVDFDYARLGRLAVRAGSLVRRRGETAALRVLLPCELILRRSTEGAASEPPSLFVSPEETDGYFADEKTARLLSAETLMQTSSETDRRILFLLAEDQTYAQIAEEVFLTERAVSYRVDALKRKMSVRHVGEIKAIFQSFLSGNAEK